jgi:hypothetical protein
MTCNCYSYNWCVGEDPEVVLEVPKELLPIIRRETVCVDACIVKDVKALWKAGIVTHGACCGHNRIPKNIVLDTNISQDLVDKCKDILGESFELYAWMDVDKVYITRVG